MTTSTIGSGGTYTTLQSWEIDSPASLVAAQQIWRGEILNATDSFTVAGTVLTISGVTTNASYYTELTTAAGASFRDNANVQTNALRFNTNNGCSIISTGYAASAVMCSQNFTRMSNVQIALQGGGGQGSGGIYFNSGPTGTLDINNCIIEGTAADIINIGGSATQIRNSLAVTRGDGRARIVGFNYNARAFNCTFAVPSDKTPATSGIYTNSNGSFRNCAVFGVSAFRSGTGSPTVTSCYSNQADTGVTQVTYNTTQFENITDATRDFRIPSGSAMKDNGTTDSTYAAVDIAGTSRPQGSGYDVGAWEYVSAAANAPQMMMMGVG